MSVIDKYPVSKYTADYYVVMILIMLLCEAMFLGTMLAYGFNIASAFLVVFGAFGILLAIYEIFFGLPSAKYSFSEEGITTYIGRKKYEHRWSDFRSTGIIYFEYHQSVDAAWVYFSKSFLTTEEKRRFAGKTRKRLDSIAYFSYSKSALARVMEKLPDDLRGQLKFEEELMLDKMDVFDKRMTRR